MKKILFFCSMILALGFVACDKEEMALSGLAENQGVASLRILTDTRSGDYDPMDYYTIRIYSTEGLIRKYTSEEPMPEELKLLAGSYSIEADLGDWSVASFSRKSYRGSADFTVEAGKQTAVEVVCATHNAAVTVNYDATVAANLSSGFKTNVALESASLDYLESATGYFLCTEETLELAWSFVGEHPVKGDLSQQGTLTVKAGGKYTLNFVYSKDGNGFMDFSIEVVEPTPENGGDVIIFSPEPVFKGVDFDLEQEQKFYNATRTLAIASPNALSSLSLEVDGDTYDLANTTVTGITVVKTDEKNWTVTLADTFFSSYAGGTHTLKFVAEDSDGGRGKSELLFTTQGIVPAEAGDYDLWTNKATIRVKIFDPSVSSVAVKMRRTDGEWTTYTANRVDEETFAAAVEPQWTATTNTAGAAAWVINPATGVMANATYETKAVIDGVEKDAVASFTTTVDQPIPDASFENGSLSCFTQSNANAIFWGSGNNSYKKQLCVQSTFAGMDGNACVKMATSEALGMMAAGNLFTGTFSMSGTTGTVGFGQDYDWKARPSAIRFKYHATVGLATGNKYPDETTGEYPVKEGEQDKARIYALIVDWSSRPQVSSGTNAPTGCFDPAGITSLSAGKVIGAAVLMIDASTSGDQMVTAEVPFMLYDKEAKPSSTYKIVIAASSNAYGDYMCGCNSNCLYVDDFEWVY